jgi:hypothetical protein
MKRTKNGSFLHKKRVVSHTVKRAKERYNIWFPDEIHEIAKMIKKFRDSGNSMMLEKASTVMLLFREKRDATKFHYLVEFRNKYYWAVWAASMQTINTFLPLEGLKTRIGFMSNSIVGFLSSRNLINLDEYKQFDVVKHEPKEEEITNADSWVKVEACVHNDPAIPHHSIRNQPEQLLDVPLYLLPHTRING